ncbi:hypothetical protein KY290_031345 [Solanum tuberosum]|uniref:Uncharacterized protein n=1 Tax=Solanum tuberosum TaxID=4113 RepID=A0ABQ7U8W4_SOLTU|nr:hypothetical protein KY290_031345 [Solanum tuberosum]
MEKLDELEEINLLAIMLEHMHRVMTWKTATHGIPYGYLLNYMFKHLHGTTKQMFIVVTLVECECVKGKAKGRYHVEDLLKQQATLKQELTDLTGVLNDKEVEIAQLKSQLQKLVSKGPGTSGVDEQVMQKLRAKNEQLLKTNASLSEEVKALNKQVIRAHKATNERMSLLMRTLTPLPPPS